MAEPMIPGPDATAEEWGRLAVSLPGWWWMPGIRMLPIPEPGLPDADSFASAGCLLALLGSSVVAFDDDDADPACGPWSVAVPGHTCTGLSMGRACIAAAAALGRWPGGAA